MRIFFNLLYGPRDCERALLCVHSRVCGRSEFFLCSAGRCWLSALYAFSCTPQAQSACACHDVSCSNTGTWAKTKKLCTHAGGNARHFALIPYRVLQNVTGSSFLFLPWQFPHPLSIIDNSDNRLIFINRISKKYLVVGVIFYFKDMCHFLFRPQMWLIKMAVPQWPSGC